MDVAAKVKSSEFQKTAFAKQPSIGKAQQQLFQNRNPSNAGIVGVSTDKAVGPSIGKKNTGPIAGTG